MDTLSTIVDTFELLVHMIIPSPEVRESAPDSIQICEMMGDHSEPSSMLRFNLPRSPEITVYKCHMDCLQKVSTNVERSRRPPWPQPAAHAHASSADSMAGPPTAVGTATEAPWGATGTSVAAPTEAASGSVRGPPKLRTRRAVV